MKKVLLVVASFLAVTCFAKYDATGIINGEEVDVGPAGRASFERFEMECDVERKASSCSIIASFYGIGYKGVVKKIS